jgi:hypothetical protein
MEFNNKPDKEVFEYLFNNLFENKIIYHERVTILCEVDRFEVTEKRFEIWLKPLKPLMKLSGFRENFYNRLVEKKIFSLAASFEFGDTSTKLFDGKLIGRPYCPFMLWPLKELVENICKLEGEALKEEISKLY